MRLLGWTTGGWVAGAALVLLCIGGCASTSEPLSAPERVLAEIPLNRAHPATPLVAPVQFRGQTLSFVLDTGSTITIFDSQLRSALGTPVETQKARTGSGVMQLETFRTPEAYLSGIRLRTEGPIACADLAAYRDTVRATSGHDVHGIIGMDFLRNYRLRLDFDRGTVAVLEPRNGRATEWGEPLEIQFKAKGIPSVVAALPDGTHASFIVDTGEAATGDLRGEIYESLQRAGCLAQGRRVACATGSGYHEIEEGVLSRLDLGPHRRESLPMFRSTWNGLGLTYLAGYNVLFDFPQSRLYLKPRITGPAAS